MSCTNPGCTRSELRDGLCLCHLANKRLPEANAFFSYVMQQVENRGDTNFTEFVFPPGFQISSRTFETYGNFARAIFEGDMSFDHVNFKQGATFNEAKFASTFSVKDTTFGTFGTPSVVTTFDEARFAKLVFERVQFTSLAQFNRCTFSADSTFDNVTFIGNAGFQACIFSGQAAFLSVDFRRDAVFAQYNGVSTLFAKYATFAQTEFHGAAHFDHVDFREEANFDNAHFGGFVSFNDAQFEGRSSFFGASFDWQAHFNQTKFQLAEFVQTTFRDVASFKAPVVEETQSASLIFHFTRFEKSRQVAFLAIPFESLSFLKTDVAETLIVPPKSGVVGEEILDEVLLRFSKGEPISSKTTDQLERGVAILASYLMEETVIYEYKNLRQSLENNRLFNEAAELFVHEMRMARKRSGFSFEFVASWLYDKISLFGESIKRPVLWSVAIIVAITLYVDVSSNPLPLWNVTNLGSVVRALYQHFWPIVSDVVTVFFQMRDFTSTNTLAKSPVWAEIFLRVSSIVLLGNLFVAVKRRLERK